MSPSKSRTTGFYFAVLLTGAVFYAGGLLHGRFIGRGWPFDLDEHATKTDGHTDHDGHDHGQEVAGQDHAGHDHGSSNENSLELSETARKNLGLTDEYLPPIELRSFDRTISVPAIVIDKPGRTRLPVSAATTGIVTHVHAVTGEALSSGDLILEMRLTHEDLVTAQKEYLQALGDRDVEMKEIARIEKIASSGAVSNKTLLERQYNRDKVDSLLKSQREALRLHGLSDAQIESIESDRRLLTDLKVTAPDPDGHSVEELQLSRSSSIKLGMRSMELPVNAKALQSNPFRLTASGQDSAESLGASGTEAAHSHPSNPSKASDRILILQDLHAQKGQVVNAGELLCTLADFSELLIEGQAFESEASLVAQAKLGGWKVAALVEESGQSTTLQDLELGWVNNEIDPATRALKFYVLLPNVLLQESRNASGQRHAAWRFRTGQRMQLQVPVERWLEQIVLPVNAVVREGIESFVFQQNGDHYDRIPVHERHRDQTSVVIENDGTLYPGDVVALRGAHQMQMALKNKSGGALDPHAGHNH